MTSGKVIGVEPLSASTVDLASSGFQPHRELVQRSDGAIETDVVASGEIGGQFLRAEDDEDGPVWMGDERHPGFDVHIWPGLEPPVTAGSRRPPQAVAAADVLVRGEERNDSLDVLESTLKYLVDKRVPDADAGDELVPFPRF